MAASHCDKQHSSYREVERKGEGAASHWQSAATEKQVGERERKAGQAIVGKAG